MYITSRQNPNVALYRALCREKREREKKHLFCIEGLKLAGEAAKSGIEVVFTMATKYMVERHTDVYMELAEKAGAAVISDDIGEYISDTDTPQGFFIIAKTLDKTADMSKIENGRYIILDEVRDPGNVGTIIRTAEALGVDGVILSEGCADIYSPKVVRSTMGSIFRLPFRTAELKSEIERLRQGGTKVYASALDKSALSIRAAGLSGSCAVIIGNEANGVRSGIMDAADGKIYIPINKAESLNAAAAAAIFCYEMTAENRE